jgi:two-component system sensor histidine kinase/response regulator
MPYNTEKSIVLLVDDMPENLEMLGSCLKPVYRILAARNGEKALMLAKTRGPDLILLDILMPGMNGFEVLDSLKSDRETEKIPVIFISGMDQQDAVVRGFKAGAQDYISKPFETEELRARVATHIQLKRQTDQLNNMNTFLESEVRERTRALQISNRKLKAANDRLNMLSRVKSRFLNMISHEMRMPLALMSQYIELLGSELSSEKYIGYVTDLDEAYQRLRLFSEKALLITQLDSDAYAIRKEPVEIVPLINELIKNKAAQWKEKSLRFAGLQDLDIQIIGDLRLLVFLFQSLIENAVQYSPRDGLIRFKVKHTGESCIMEITDEGPGFPPEVMHYAFEPFSLGEDPVALKLGLSLSICHFIMKSHGGEIVLNNRASKGAAVRLVFYSTEGGCHVRAEEENYHCRR